VVLAYAEYVKTGLVSERCGGENFGVALRYANRTAGVRVGGDVTEGVETYFQSASCGSRFSF